MHPPKIDLESAVNEMIHRNLDKELLKLTKAIEICPENNPRASELYYMRAKIYEKKGISKFRMEIYNNLTEAMRLNPSEKKYLDRLVYHISRIAYQLYDAKYYEKAAEAVEICLKGGIEKRPMLRLQRLLELQQIQLTYLNNESQSRLIKFVFKEECDLQYSRIQS